MKDIIELENRRKIFNIILKNPGLHLSKIAEQLSLRISHVEYHLLYLEKNQIITSQKEAGYARYYIKGKTGIKDKKILAVLRQEVPLKIVLFMLKHPISKHKEILKHFNISKSTLSYHLKKLMKKEIITIYSDGEESGYLIINKREIIDLLIKYKPFDTNESFKAIWEDLTVD